MSHSSITNIWLFFSTHRNGKLNWSSGRSRHRALHRFCDVEAVWYLHFAKQQQELKYILCAYPYTNIYSARTAKTTSGDQSAECCTSNTRRTHDKLMRRPACNHRQPMNCCRHRCCCRRCFCGALRWASASCDRWWFAYIRIMIMVVMSICLWKAAGTNSRNSWWPRLHVESASSTCTYTSFYGSIICWY